MEPKAGNGKWKPPAISPLLWLGWGLGTLLLLMAAVMALMLLGPRWSTPRKGIKL